MTRLLAVLALALMLVLSLGGSAQSGVLPWEDYDHPIDGRDVGDGDDDGDHPWGGDRVIGSGLGDNDYRYVDITVVTGYPILDVIISRFVQSIALNETTPVVSASNPELAAETYRRSHTITTRARANSTIGNWKER